MIHNSTSNEVSAAGTSGQEGNRRHRSRQGQCCVARGYAFYSDGYATVENETAACPRRASGGRFDFLASRRMAESA